MVGTSQGEEAAVLTFLRWLGEPGAGLKTIYGALDYLTDRFELEDAVLVVESESTGSQLFRSRGRPLDRGRAAQLLAKGPGIYTVPDVVPPELREVVLALAPVAINLQIDAGRSTADVVDSPGKGFEAALGVAAANGSRYGWLSTVVVFDVGTERRESHPASEAAQALDEGAVSRVEAALDQVLRTGDAAGRVGENRFGALLANARTDEAGAFLGRLREALGPDLAHVAISIGAACAPEDSVDPDELLRLAGERMG
jgi:hypothetical protein